MTYVKSASGKWHREDCRHSPDEGAAEEDDLPVEGEHCKHCIGSFDFPEA